MLKAAIFDIDDTLYKFLPVHITGLNAAYIIYSRLEAITFEKFKEEFHASWEYVKKNQGNRVARASRALIFQHLIEKRLGTGNTDIALDLERQYWDALIENIVPYEGVVKLFQFLKQRDIKIGIITDLTATIQLKKLKKMGLSDFIDVFVSAEEYDVVKPSQKLFKLAIDKLGIKPADAIMVGDNADTDTFGAKKCGMKAIQLVKNRFSKKMIGDKKADYYVNEFSEIKKIIETLLP